MSLYNPPMPVVGGNAHYQFNLYNPKAPEVRFSEWRAFKEAMWTDKMRSAVIVFIIKIVIYFILKYQ